MTITGKLVRNVHARCATGTRKFQLRLFSSWWLLEALFAATAWPRLWSFHPPREFAMARISGITLFAFVAIQIVALVAAQPNCGSLSLNGNTFNLNVLEQAAQPFQTQDTFGAYEFRVCSNFQCGSTPSAACQETSQPAMYSLGSWSPSTTAAYVNNAVVFTNSPTGSPPRGSTISVVCGQGVRYGLPFFLFSPSFPRYWRSSYFFAHMNRVFPLF